MYTIIVILPRSDGGKGYRFRKSSWVEMLHGVCSTHGMLYGIRKLNKTEIKTEI